VSYTIRQYESLGVAAVFIEDQVAPKRCGHLSGKRVVPPELMERKIEAAAAARQNPDSLFLIARTDALEPQGIDNALCRGERYLKAGADGIYIEAPKSEKHLEQIGSTFKGTPQVTNMFEGDDETPWLTPRELHRLGFSMILYPTTLLFQVVKTLQIALDHLRDGKPSNKKDAVRLKEYEEIVGLDHWAKIEKRFASDEMKE
jgi:2-methylisocitrate lyase-like PEP mutase family enzyme